MSKMTTEEVSASGAAVSASGAAVSASGAAVSASGAAVSASLKLPWEIRELPYRDGTRSYVFWPDGVSRPALPEELQIWNYVKNLEKRLELALANLASLATPKKK